MAATRRINVDLPLIIVAVALTIFGLAIVYSAGQTDVPTQATGAWKHQIVWTVVGIIGAYAGSVDHSMRRTEARLTA